jgi:hypothetical protein
MALNGTNRSSHGLVRNQASAAIGFQQINALIVDELLVAVLWVTMEKTVAMLILHGALG